MATQTIFRTYTQGQRAPLTGTYEVVQADGRRTGVTRRFVRGEPLLRTPDPSQRYILVDTK